MRDTSQPVLGQGPISLGYRVGHIRNDGRALRSILYNKSAVVLHMLRRYIGDEAFFAGLRKFYADWRFKKAGTDDLQAAFQAATPQNLDVFFDKWIRGFTVPRIKLSWHADADGTVGRHPRRATGRPLRFPADGRPPAGQRPDRRNARSRISGAVYEETSDAVFAAAESDGPGPAELFRFGKIVPVGSHGVTEGRSRGVSLFGGQLARGLKPKRISVPPSLRDSVRTDPCGMIPLLWTP